MTAVDDTRLELAAAIINAAIAGFPSGHVTPYPPAQLVAPAIYIDMPRIYRGSAGLSATLGTLADWPVVMVVDGDDWAQMTALDSAVAFLWDSFNGTDGWECVDASPIPKDVGGPQLRSYQLTVTTFLTLDVLCPSLSAIAVER